MCVHVSVYLLISKNPKFLLFEEKNHFLPYEHNNKVPLFVINKCMKLNFKTTRSKLKLMLLHSVVFQKLVSDNATIKPLS